MKRLTKIRLVLTAAFVLCLAGTFFWPAIGQYPLAIQVAFSVGLLLGSSIR